MAGDMGYASMSRAETKDPRSLAVIAGEWTSARDLDRSQDPPSRREARKSVELHVFRWRTYLNLMPAPICDALHALQTGIFRKAFQHLGERLLGFSPEGNVGAGLDGPAWVGGDMWPAREKDDPFEVIRPQPIHETWEVQSLRGEDGEGNDHPAVPI